MKLKTLIIILAVFLVLLLAMDFKDETNNTVAGNTKTEYVEQNIKGNDVSQDMEGKGEKNMEVLEITSNNFEQEVMQSDKVVIIDFWAEWCGPCRQMSPIIEQIAEENQELKVCKVNVDEENALSIKYGITAIPTILIIKNGEVVERFLGVTAKDKIVKSVEK